MAKKQKTTNEIKAQIAALKGDLRKAERAERERIGIEMQRRTGKETWAEIAAILEGKRAKPDGA